MKKILLFIIFALITIACKKEIINNDYSQEVHTTIETYIKDRVEAFNVEVSNITILQSDNITVSNINDVEKNIKKISSFISNPSMYPGQPTDTIIKAYNEILDIQSSSEVNPIGKIMLIKSSMSGTDNVEKIGYFSIILNKRNNIPADIKDLLND